MELVDTLGLGPSAARRGGSSPSLGTILRSIAQPGSALGLGPRGPRFESLYSDHLGELAQLGERRLCKS